MIKDYHRIIGVIVIIKWRVRQRHMMARHVVGPRARADEFFMSNFIEWLKDAY